MILACMLIILLLLGAPGSCKQVEKSKGEPGAGDEHGLVCPCCGADVQKTEDETWECISCYFSWPTEGEKPKVQDTDGDGLGNPCDNCGNIANPDQRDTDGDGAGDACDGCPSDADKVAPGACGCGVEDDDSDGDGVADCVDNCPDDANAGQTDADGDGIGDGCDNCLDTANSDQTDADSDDAGDACDGCPSDANKVAPGACGCGVEDDDFDGDEVADCVDNCPTIPGVCAVGTWSWFNGATVEIESDGTQSSSKGNYGTWELTDPSSRLYTVSWVNGGWIDELTLSADGMNLAGWNNGNPPYWVTGTRL